MDYILYLLDASKELDIEETGYIKKLPSHTVVIYNKTDLNAPTIPNDLGKKVYCISAKNNEGVSELLDGIRTDIEERLEKSESEETLFSERHYQALLMAEESLQRAISTLKMDLEADICSIDLEDAASYLGEITGTTVNDEVIDNIFKNFCIGK